MPYLMELEIYHIASEEGSRYNVSGLICSLLKQVIP